MSANKMLNKCKRSKKTMIVMRWKAPPYFLYVFIEHYYLKKQQKVHGCLLWICQTQESPNKRWALSL